MRAAMNAQGHTLGSQQCVSVHIDQSRKLDSAYYRSILYPSRGKYGCYIRRFETCIQFCLRSC